MKPNTVIKHLIKRKIATVVLISASLAAFAALGDGGRNKQQKRLLSVKSYSSDYKTFSLKSTYNYRGNNILKSYSNNNYIMLNTVITYQKGNTTYILPMKRKVFLDKITFNPSH